MASAVLSAVSFTTTLASATYVVTEPTATRVKNPSSINHTALYISTRVLTIGGLTLLLIGLCCLCAIVIKYSRMERQAVLAVDDEKALVLDQNTINQFCPIRIHPSRHHLFMDKDDMVFVTQDSIHVGDCIREKAGNGVDMDHEKQGTPQPNQQQQKQYSIMNLSRLGQLWSRDSSRCNSVFNSPAPSHAARMPTFTTIMLQSTPVLSPGAFAVPMQQPEETTAAEELCSICLSEYVADDRIRILTCGHEYHAECVDTWLCQKSTQCPLCKHDLLEDLPPSSPTTIVEIQS